MHAAIQAPAFVYSNSSIALGYTSYSIDISCMYETNYLASYVLVDIAISCGKSTYVRS